MAYKSNYNYFFLRNDNTLGVFNTLNGSLVVLNEQKKLEFDQMPDSNIKINTEFKEKLVKLGILRENSFDEKAVVNSSRFRRAYIDKSVYLRILTTTDCNARCPYCYESGVNKRTMSKETAEQVIKFILDRPRLEKFYIHWFGGEPLMNVSIIDIIMDGVYDKLSSVGTEVSVYFTSNGSLLNRQLVKRAKEKWHTTWFQITIDDLNDEYNKIKKYVNKNHNFNIVIDNIDMLLQEGIMVNIRINYFPDEVEKVKKVIVFLKEKFSSYYSKKLVNISPAPIFNIIDDKREESIKSSVCCNVFEPNVFLEQLGLKNSSDLFDLSFKGGQCFACHQGSFIIDPLGNLFKCTITINDEKTKVGTIFDGFEANREYFKWVNPILPEECNECKFLPICQGGCRAGYLGYIDYCCNRVIPELDKILEYKIQNLKNEKLRNIDERLAISSTNDIYLS